VTVRHLDVPRDLSQARGFSLIELMIVVAIIALLSSIAYPAYTGSVLKGKRAEGRAALLETMQQQERYYSQYGSYLAFAAGATGAAGTARIGGTDTSGRTIPFKTTSGQSASNSAYRIAAAACTGLNLTECVQLTASINGTDTEFGNLTLNSAGTKGCSTGNAKCWAR